MLEKVGPRRNSTRLEGRRSMSWIQIAIWFKIYILPGSCLDSYLASPWPQRHIGPEMPPCHMLHVAVRCLAQTGSVRRPLSPLVVCDPSQSRRSDACSSSHSGWLGCSSSYNRLHLRPWLMGRDFHKSLECRHRSASRIAPGEPKPSLWYRENLGSSLKM